MTVEKPVPAPKPYQCECGAWMVSEILPTRRLGYFCHACALRDERKAALEEAAVFMDEVSRKAEKDTDPPSIEGLTVPYIVSSTALNTAKAIRALKDTPEETK